MRTTLLLILTFAIPALVSAACGPSVPAAAPTEPEATSSATAPAAPLPTAPKAETPKPNEKTLFVRESLVDCQGEAPMKCMQVRESESEEWTYFYAPIEGFEHQEGFRYELRVEVSNVTDPPADSSSLRYRLVKVIKKEQVTSGSASP